MVMVTVTVTAAAAVPEKREWRRSGRPVPFLRLVVCLGAALLLIWIALGVTLGVVLGSQRPDLVLAIWPWSAPAKAAMANRIVLDPGVGADDLDRGLAFAREALAREPVNVVAARSIGLYYARKRQAARAMAWFNYSERLSRRDLPVQIWLIQQSVEAGNVQAALVHYDRALRSSVEAEATLLPVLRVAANDPAIAVALGRTLAKRPFWRMPFLRDTLAGMTNTNAVIALTIEARLTPKDLLDKTIVETALGRMVMLGKASAAKRLSQRYHAAAAGGNLVMDGDFADPSALQPFAWGLSGEDDLSAEEDTDADGRPFLTVHSANGHGGIVANQLLLLAPGAYVVTGAVAGTASSSGAGPAIVATCDDGHWQWSSPLPPAHDGPTAFRLQFTIPDGCVQQHIGFRVSPAFDTDAKLYRMRLLRL